MAANNSPERDSKNDWLFIATEPEGTIVTRKDSVSYSKRAAGADGECSTQDGNESEPEFEILSSFQCVPAPEVDDIALPFPAVEPSKSAAEEVVDGGTTSDSVHADDDILIISDYFSERNGDLESRTDHPDTTDTQDDEPVADDDSDTDSVIGLCELLRILEGEEYSSGDEQGDSDDISDKSQDFEVVDECDGVDEEPMALMDSVLSASTISGCSYISTCHLFAGFNETDAEKKDDYYSDLDVSSDLDASSYQIFRDIDSDIEADVDESRDSSDVSSFHLLFESDIEEENADDDEDENFLYNIDLFDDSDDEVELIEETTQSGNGLHILREDEQVAGVGFVHVDIPTFLILLCLTTALGFSIGHGINAYLNQRTVRLSGGKPNLVHKGSRVGLDITRKTDVLDNPSGDYFTMWRLKEEIAEGEELLEHQRDTPEHLDLNSFQRKLHDEHYKLLQSYENVKHKLHVTKVMSWYWRIKYENQKNYKINANLSETFLSKRLQHLEASYAREKRLADLWRVIAERSKPDRISKLTKQSMLEKFSNYWKVLKARMNTIMQKHSRNCSSSKEDSKPTKSHQGLCNANLTGFKNRWITKKTHRNRKSCSTATTISYVSKQTAFTVPVYKALKINQARGDYSCSKAVYSPVAKPSQKCQLGKRALSGGVKSTKVKKTLRSKSKIRLSKRSNWGAPVAKALVRRSRKSKGEYQSVPTSKKNKVCKFCEKSSPFRNPGQQKSDIPKQVKTNEDGLLSHLTVTQTKTSEKSAEIVLNEKHKGYEKLYAVGRDGHVDEIVLYGPIKQSHSIHDVRFHSNGSLAEIVWSGESAGEADSFFLSVFTYKPNFGRYEEMRRDDTSDTGRNRKAMQRIHDSGSEQRPKSSETSEITVIACKNGTVLRKSKMARRNYNSRAERSSTLAVKTKKVTSTTKKPFKLATSYSKSSGFKDLQEKRKNTNKRRREFLVNKVRTLLVKKRETKQHERQLEKRMEQEKSEMNMKKRHLREQRNEIKRDLKLLKRQKREFKKERKHHEEKMKKKLKELEHKLKKEHNRLEKWKEKEEKELKRTLRKDWEKLKLKQRKTEKKRAKEVERIKKDLTKKKKTLSEREKELKSLKRKLETNYRKWANTLWEKIKLQQREFERWAMWEKEHKKSQLKERRQEELERVIAAQLRYERQRGRQRQNDRLRVKQNERKRKLQTKEQKQDFKDWRNKRIRKYDQKMKARARKEKHQRKYWKELERLQQWLLQVEEQKVEQEPKINQKCPRKTTLFENPVKKASRTQHTRPAADHTKGSPAQHKGPLIKRMSSLIETKKEQKGMTLFNANLTLGFKGKNWKDALQNVAASTEALPDGSRGDWFGKETESENDSDVVIEIDEGDDFSSGPAPPTWLPRRCSNSILCDDKRSAPATAENTVHPTEFPNPSAPLVGQRKSGDWYLQRAREREVATQEPNRGPIPPERPRRDWYYRRAHGREELHQKLIFGPWKGDASRSAPDWFFLRTRGREKLHRESFNYGPPEEHDHDSWYSQRVKGREKDRFEQDDTWFLERGYDRQNLRAESRWEDDHNMNWFLHRNKGRFG